MIQRIVRIQSAPKPERLNQETFNKRTWWEIDQKTLKGLKARPEKLSIERLVDWGSIMA